MNNTTSPDNTITAASIASSAISTGFSRFTKGIVSFFVGLSYFFFYKIPFQIGFLIWVKVSTNSYLAKIESGVIEYDETLVTAWGNDLEKSIQGLSSLAIILCIYLAVKASKKLNRNTNIKRPALRRVIIISLGFIAMIFSTVFVQVF